MLWRYLCLHAVFISQAHSSLKMLPPALPKGPAILSTKQLASQCSQHSSGWISLAGLSHMPGSEPFSVARASAASGWLLESAKVVREEERECLGHLHAVKPAFMGRGTEPGVPRR